MYTDRFKQVFLTRLDNWTSLHAAYRETFTESDVLRLENAASTFDKASRRVVVLSFENDIVALGGLAAVARQLPAALALQGERVTVVTPMHVNHPSMKRALASGKVRKAFDDPAFVVAGDSLPLVCFEGRDRGIPIYYIGIERYFFAPRHPYDYSDKALLVADSLAFCAAVPAVLAKLSMAKDIVIHANDWETALVGLSSKAAICAGTLQNALTILTLHNSFDCGLSPEAGQRYFGRRPPGETVLQAAIPFLDGPITAVSTPFAHELLHDPLLSTVFCPHLQALFSANPPVGVENGVFASTDAVFSAQALDEARNKLPKRLLAEKRAHKKQFLAAVSAACDKGIVGTLAQPGTRRDVPLFVMTGRLDLTQKGFDVFFQAFRQLPRGMAKLFFSPSNPTRAPGDATMDFFFDIVEECKGDITMWPFHIPDSQYRSCLRGASFLVMPSLYEPFGAATEGYAAGAPVLARATGGLWAQVESLTKCPSPAFYSGLLQPDHGESAKPTGILYREAYEGEDAARQWQTIFSNPVGERMSIPLYREMVKQAHEAIVQAVKLYKTPKRYAQVVVNGIDHVSRFDWQATAQAYAKVYDVAIRTLC